jgi:pantetheine-phosphate adenylyltransferase
LARRAIFAGSFDPVTLGHVDLVRRAAALFERVVVAIGHNPDKRTWFSIDERLALMRACVGSDIDVVSFQGLLVDAARAHRADVILRGIRGTADLELELRNAQGNRHLAGLETLFLATDPALAFVSSSLVREIAHHGGDVSGLVPEPVRVALAGRSPR